MPENQYIARPLTLRDLSACLSLSAAAGWNQTESDWETQLTFGRGAGIENADRELVGTGVVLPFSKDVEWVSMVLVREDLRRRGLATRLVRELLDGSSASRHALDATEYGTPLYRKLSFVDQERVVRMKVDVNAVALTPKAAGGRAFAVMKRPRSETGAVGIDCFPAERMYETVRVLVDRSDVSCYECLTQHGERVAIGYLRPGRKAWHIGPVYSESAAAAAKLVCDVAFACLGEVQVDVPIHREGLILELTEVGFVMDRGFMRMARRGACPIPKEVSAIAGPEYG